MQRGRGRATSPPLRSRRIYLPCSPELQRAGGKLPSGNQVSARLPPAPLTCSVPPLAPLASSWRRALPCALALPPHLTVTSGRQLLAALAESAGSPAPGHLLLCPATSPCPLNSASNLFLIHNKKYNQTSSINITQRPPTTKGIDYLLCSRPKC